MRDDPVVIGGTGGSGTRVIARMVRDAGVFLGERLNGSDDALDLAEFDWAWGLDYLRDGATDPMRAAFEVALERHLAPLGDPQAAWGWKHPHSYLLLPFLAERFPAMRFVHVIRDGRDMALSGNQAQLGQYGEHTVGSGADQDPVRRIRFWARANSLAAEQGAALLGDRYTRIRYEDLCARPRKHARRLLIFAGGAQERLPAMTSEVQPPESLGRGREAEAGVLAEMEAAAGPALAEFGYALEAGAPEAATPEAATLEAAALEVASEQTLADQLREQAGPPPARRSWPRVSIVVPTRDGRPLLERLIAGLEEATDYPDVELVVVDNASTDGTLEWLRELDTAIPLVLVANPVNLSFSDACNRGAAAASGDLLLFLNNDIEPIEPAWLRRLVTSLDEAGAAMAGAMLVDPDRPGESGTTGALQHRGIILRAAGGAVRPGLAGKDEDPRAALGPDRPAAGVVAACALVRARAFRAVGGFSDLYHYGGEDTDLGFKLIAAGHGIVVSGRSVLLHRPLSTRRGSPVADREHILGNQRLLLERWGPRMRREYALDREAGHGVWTDPVAEGGEDWDAEVSVRVLAGEPAWAARAQRLARRLRRTGLRVNHGEDGDGWLLDDVVLHVTGGRVRSAVIPGRLNVLVRLGEAPEALDRAQAFDLVLAAPADPADLRAAILEALAARGGPWRIAPQPRPAPRQSERRSVIVLGPSRSGTSATSRLLNLCGVDLGADDLLIPAKEGENERGFFENHDIVRINGAVLRALGGDWDRPPALPTAWEEDPALDDLRERAKTLLSDCFGTAPLWGFKDPRTCLTLPFWRPLLDEPTFVLCHRNPLDVAASLGRRNGIGLRAGVDLWTRSMAAAIVNTIGSPRTIIGYDELFAARGRALRALAGAVGQPEMAEDPGLRALAEEWVDPHLRHHHSSVAATVAHPGVDDRTTALFLALERAVAARETEPALAGAAASGPISDALDAVALRALSGRPAAAGARTDD